MDFKEAVDLIVKFEGGYVNDPKDPGGETKFGISKRSYPDVDINNLTVGHAKHIYESDYWHTVKCDGLPSILRLAAFDSAVNQGVGFTVKALQSSCGAKADGVLGPKTLERISQESDIELLNKFLNKRMLRYLSNKNFDRYGKGWLTRLIHVSVLTQSKK